MSKYAYSEDLDNLGSRQRRPPIWPVVSLGLIIILCGAVATTVGMQIVGIDCRNWIFHSTLHVLAFAVGMAIGCMVDVAIIYLVPFIMKILDLLNLDR